jgi:acylphosphatase
MSNEAAFKAVVHGLVQGVSYRHFVLRNARMLDIAGYAKNLRDGSVEVVAEGEREQLEQLLVRLKMGPREARVDQVEVKWSEYSGRYGGFDIVF